MILVGILETISTLEKHRLRINGDYTLLVTIIGLILGDKWSVLWKENLYFNIQYGNLDPQMMGLTWNVNFCWMC